MDRILGMLTYYGVLMALLVVMLVVCPWLTESLWFVGPFLLGWFWIFWESIKVSYVKVPTAHKGIPKFLELRLEEVLDEGFHFIMPFFMDVEPVPYEQKKGTLTIEVLSKVKKGTPPIRITIKGSFEWKLEPHPGQLRKYRELTEEAIVDGIKEEVQRHLEELAGRVEADDFISQREAIGLYVNCLLRLPPKDVPHHDKPMEELLANYETKKANIKSRLIEERKRQQERSEVEERYGIDIIIARISDIDFSQEVKEAFEEQRRAKEQVKGREVEKQKLTSMTKSLGKLGLGPNEAANDALVILGKATKNVISVEGGGGALPLVMLQPPVSASPEKSQSKRKKGKPEKEEEE